MTSNASFGLVVQISRRLNESAMGNALEQKFVQMRHPLFVTLVVQEPLETLALHLRVAQQFLAQEAELEGQ